MSFGKRSLSCFGDQFKLFFLGNNHVPKKKELKLPQGTTMCPREQGFKLLGETSIPGKQMCLKLYLIIIFAYEF
jgi:hypothetical protein